MTAIDQFKQLQRDLGVDDDGFNGPITRVAFEALGRAALEEHSAADVKPAGPAPSAGYVLGAVSLANLRGVHPDLVRVAERAILLTPIEFRVVDGVRTLAEEKRAVASGASQTMHSRHLTGHAIDFAAIVKGVVDWDWTYYPPIAAAFKAAAVQLGIAITWGGDWKTLKDGGHIELSWTSYPA